MTSCGTPALVRFWAAVLLRSWASIPTRYGLVTAPRPLRSSLAARSHAFAHAVR